MRGNITRFRLGNGAESIRTHDAENGRITSIYSTHGGSVVQDLTYVFDAVGNLTQRTDARQGYTENAVYDNLNRVIQVNTQTGVAAADTGLYLPASMWNGTSTSIAVTYNVLGNITSKTDIGTYGYGETHSACSSVTGAVASAGPRAVSSTSGTSTADYCYDANGNLLSGDGRSVTWTDFGKPERITRGSNTVDISYGPDRARYKRVDTSATSTTTTRYIGGKLYEAIDRAGALEQKHYIGGFAVITVHVATNVTETRYMLTDHLGSVDTIMEASGSVVERMSFDPWGKRRQINWVPINDPAGYMPLVTTRGFTNHEQLDPVGLVHMNGRVYDPELGRFLSADIVVQDVTNLQSWNAYSYVLNNPLSYTDPTGFFFKSLFKAIGNFFKGLFKAVKSVVKAIARNPIVSAIVKIATCAPFGPGIGACLGVTAALTIGAGGSLGDALIASALAFISHGAGLDIWGHVSDALGAVKATSEALFAVVKPAVHGAVAGALNVIQGGEFLHGFASGAAGAIGGMVGVGIFGQPGRAGDAGGFIGRTAIASVAGGAASKLSGGKFANGAVTAAFAHMYNAEGGGRKIGIGHNRPPKPSWSARIARGIGAAFRRIPGVGAFITVMSPTAVADGTLGAQALNFSDRQLQSKFKHAQDFGISGNYSQKNALLFRNAIQSHVSNSSTTAINGFYRGSAVTHHVNPNTGLNVISGSNNSFISGWRLSPEQLRHVINSGKLGGG